MPLQGTESGSPLIQRGFGRPSLLQRRFAANGYERNSQRRIHGLDVIEHSPREFDGRQFPFSESGQHSRRLNQNTSLSINLSGKPGRRPRRICLRKLTREFVRLPIGPPDVQQSHQLRDWASRDRQREELSVGHGFLSNHQQCRRLAARADRRRLRRPPPAMPP